MILFQIITDFMNKHFLLAAALLLSFSFAQKYEAVFALSWYSGFCESINGACDQEKTDLWDHQSFTIHGFWPSTKGQPIGQFDVSLFSEETLDDMLNYWPPKSRTTGSDYFLWEHEFEKHGKDFASAAYRLHPQNFPSDIRERNAELQRNYFEQVLTLYKGLNAQKISKSSFTKEQLAETLGIQNNQYFPRCNKSGTLQQIRICYSIEKDGINRVPCRKVSNNCKGSTITLGDWEEKNQQRVTAKAGITQAHQAIVRHLTR